MRIVTHKTQDGTWEATVYNGKCMPVHIHGCENKQIALHQARDRVKELKKAGYYKS